MAPTTPADANGAANSVAEGAANGTAVGITVSSSDVNGGAITYTLTDNAGGRFAINASTGVVTVANGTLIDYENTAAAHSYSITAQASDGTLAIAQTFTIGVTNVNPSTPMDVNATANAVNEGAAVNTLVGLTASSTDPNGPPVTYTLTSDSSGGGFKVNSATGVVSVADGSKIDFETTLSTGHTHTVTVQASDGQGGLSAQTFTIGVSDVAPSAPIDSNAATNTVVEGAANGTVVGVTASSTDLNGPAVTYSLTGDTSGGGFTINATTGVVTVANSTKINFETAPGHAYNVTAQASDGTLTSAQTFTIAVTDVAPSAPTDTNLAVNTVAEGAAVDTQVGITASSTDINGPAVAYSLTGDTSGGGFKVDSSTGVVSVADSSKVDFETSVGSGHSYTVTVQASDGTLTNSHTFNIGVTNLNPSVPTDSDVTANSVAEGAAVNTLVGVTASSTDPSGPAVTYTLIGDTSGGGFKVDASTGVVSVADGSKIDFETSFVTGHTYTVTVQAADGQGGTSAQTFSIGVTNVAPSTPTDVDASPNSVAEGAAVNTLVGVTASSSEINGPPVSYFLIGDTSGGGFKVNVATGVVSVKDGSKIDFENSGAGHSYTVTVNAIDGQGGGSPQTFTIAVTDVAPSAPTDVDIATNTIAEGAANGSVVGITASSTDINGPAVAYSLVGDTSGGGFTINSSTGVVTVADATKLDYETAPGPGHTYSVTAQASDGTLTNSQSFIIAVTNVNPTTPADIDNTANSVAEGAAVNTLVGVTASSSDLNGPAVSYSITATVRPAASRSMLRPAWCRWQRCASRLRKQRRRSQPHRDGAGLRRPGWNQFANLHDRPDRRQRQRADIHLGHDRERAGEYGADHRGLHRACHRRRWHRGQQHRDLFDRGQSGRRPPAPPAANADADLFTIDPSPARCASSSRRTSRTRSTPITTMPTRSSCTPMMASTT